MAGEDKTEVLARGIVVQFPEPMNQKAEAILISNGLQTDGFEAVQISDDDITEDTLIFVMEESQRLRVIQDVERATEENTFVLSQFVGDELEILDPYGAPLQSYGLCFEVIKKSIEKLLLKL
jgi:protein-tyrosine phosphatase